MKRTAVILLIFVLTAGMLTACRRKPVEETTQPTTQATEATAMPTVTQPVVTEPTMIDTMPTPNATDDDGFTNDATDGSSILDDFTMDGNEATEGNGADGRMRRYRK